MQSRSADTLYAALSGWASNAPYIVGTPAKTVTWCPRQDLQRLTRIEPREQG